MNAVVERREAQTGSRPFFRPRRLGHANVFVSDYEKAFDFYHSIVGYEEVYRQPDNRASFISNGNTYHDMALTDVRSKFAPAGQKPGLFHLALELENEVDLVQGYNEAVAAGVKFLFTADHDVAHSLYKEDPDGNGVEVYADVIEDWRATRHGVFNRPKPEWIPGVTNEPLAQACYPKDPEIRIVKDALFHAKRVTHVGLVTRDFDAMYDYYTEIIGLSPFADSREASYAVLGGTASTDGITLLRNGGDASPGLHHIGIEVWSEDDLKESIAGLAARGLQAERLLDHPARLAVTIRDPDGLRLQFYVNRDWSAAALAGVTEAEAPYLL